MVARGQRASERVRRVAVLLGSDANDPAAMKWVSALGQGLEDLGWAESRNLRIDLRGGSENVRQMEALAQELVSLAPDVIVTSGASATKAVQQATNTIPIIITSVGDPVAIGIVKSLARPDGNVTSTTNLFNSIGGKWLELLKEAAPQIERVGVIYNAHIPLRDNYGGFASIEEAARTLNVKSSSLPYADAVDLVRGIDTLAVEPNGGLIVVAPPPTAQNRQTILRVAMQHRLPTIYQDRLFAVEGGLLAYGSNFPERFRRAAYFVDRILRGAKVSELPVELPTKFELVINLKTAKAIGLTIPESFLLRADEVIE
jgi:putative ABC transport system substrate-binding protein